VVDVVSVSLKVPKELVGAGFETGDGSTFDSAKEIDVAFALQVKESNASALTVKAAE
jgi:hypothetical protein